MKMQIEIILVVVASLATCVGSPTNGTTELPLSSTVTANYAKDNPLDHWGVETEGFHVGIHVNKETFSVGEPIPIDILLQNIESTNLIVAYDNASGPGGAFYNGYSIIVTRGTNQLALSSGRQTDSWSPNFFTGSSGFIEVAPGNVQHHRVYLDREFHLESPGTYNICGARWIRKSGEKTGVQAKSGIATITIDRADTKSDANATPMK